MMDCKRALETAGGSKDEAIKILREKGLASAQKREARAASEGVIGSYIHLGGKIGVLVELNCETDFVARNDEFQALAKELAMQVAFSNPTYLRPEDVPEDVLAAEADIAKNLAINEGRPEAALPKIVEGRLNGFFKENVLLEQAFAKDNKKTVAQVLAEAGGTLTGFVRYRVGA
jgi:elongation factor Ts